MKMDGWNTIVSFSETLFSGAFPVSFREGKTPLQIGECDGGYQAKQLSKELDIVELSTISSSPNMSRYLTSSRSVLCLVKLKYFTNLNVPKIIKEFPLLFTIWGFPKMVGFPNNYWFSY